jgi:hypothetical protein
MTVQQVAELVEAAILEARTPAPEREFPLKAIELKDLWHGDDHCMGYHHPLLVFKVLEIRKFSSVDLLRSFFYPSLAASEVPSDANEILVAVYENWERLTYEDFRAAWDQAMKIQPPRPMLHNPKCKAVATQNRDDCTCVPFPA